MAPLLIVMHVRQARREDKELAARFGGTFAAYAARVPAFVPRVLPLPRRPIEQRP